MDTLTPVEVLINTHYGNDLAQILCNPIMEINSQNQFPQPQFQFFSGGKLQKCSKSPFSHAAPE